MVKVWLVAGQVFHSRICVGGRFLFARRGSMDSSEVNSGEARASVCIYNAMSSGQSSQYVCMRKA